MRQGSWISCGAVVGFLACSGLAAAQTPEEPLRPLPPPPMPMAGRVFPVYPLYPAYGCVQIVYAKETFAAADITGYFLYAAPANYWSVSTQGWKWVPHPQAAEIAARFGVAVAGAALYDAGNAAYWSANYPQAVEYLTAATKQNPHDARAWQYLALSHWAMGQDTAAREAARRGTAAAIVYPEQNDGLLSALERIQGPARRQLTAAAADIATVNEAVAVLAQLPQSAPQ